jgi:hypothetical protein
MSKSKPNQAPESANAANADQSGESPVATTVEVIDSAVPVAPGTGTMVTTTSSVPAEAPGRKYLEIVPPKYHRGLASLRNPGQEEIFAAAMRLPEPQRTSFAQFFEQMYAEKIGVHTNQSEFRVPDLRLFQGSGSDPIRPESAVKGCSYDSDGNIITAPSAQVARLLQVPERFNGYVIAVHATRQMWWPKDEKNEPLPLAGMKPGDSGINVNVPLCTSINREVGTRFGDCGQCQYRPFGTGQPRKNECKDAWVFFVVREDFTQIYRLPIVSTSTKTGATPIISRIRPWSVPWQKSFTFETMAQTKNNTTWFQWKTSMNCTAEAPQGVVTAAEIGKVLELLARKVDAVIYYPALADLYLRAPGFAKVVDASAETSSNGLADQMAAIDNNDPVSNF